MAQQLQQQLKFAAMRPQLTVNQPPTAETSLVGKAENWWRFMALGVVVLAGLLFFARLGSRALWSSEFRWAEIAREMQLTSNYFWPTINGRVYYDKPLGSYWLVVGSTYLTGRMDETAARLPCAMAGLLAVGLLIFLGRRLYDPRTAVFAAIILATSFSFVFFSRNASADAETVTGELAALALFLRNEKRPDGWWLVGFWLIMAATSLTKGLLGFVLPSLVIGVYCCVADGWREFRQRLFNGAVSERMNWLVGQNRWLFNWKSVIAVAIASAVYLVPFVISRVGSGSEKGLAMVYRENIVRFFHPFDHRGQIYLYAYVIFALMAPWSAILPAGLFEAQRRRRIGANGARSDRFALTYFWATFAFFTLSGSRRSYYLVPILPAAALLVARLLTEPEGMLSTIGRKLRNAGFLVIAALVLVGVAGLLPPSWILPKPWSFLPTAPHRVIFAICWLICAAAVVWPLQKTTSKRVMLSLSVIGYLFAVYLFVFAMPAGDAYRGEKPFAEQARRIIGTETAQLAFFNTNGPLFYLGLRPPIPEYEHPAELSEAVKHDHIRWLIVRQRDLASLHVPATIALKEATFPWDGKEHRLNAVLLLKVGADSGS